MEDMVMNPKFWKGRRVFITGHTGFKGSWLSLWLQSLGAEITGYALSPNSKNNLFELANVERGMRSVIADLRDLSKLKHEIQLAAPEVVIHMAAQALVRKSYEDPLETYLVNVIGTANLLEAVRSTPKVKAVVNVTTDKCYENRSWTWGYRESDLLGGYDPYSSSKACAELVTAAYRTSFFNSKMGSHHRVNVASARAGNVIGGGDWAKDRLIPDLLLALERGEPALIRNPLSVRPWQHVLEPLNGYLCLAEKLASDNEGTFSNSWNFGPSDDDARPVQWIVEKMIQLWGGGAWIHDETPQPHEANYLKLDCSKAKALLGWRPHWNLEMTLTAIIDWQKAFLAGEDVFAKTIQQIREFEKDLHE
jgi:CDP-glucose 4,6-dehydratase